MWSRVSPFTAGIFRCLVGQMKSQYLLLRVFLGVILGSWCGTNKPFFFFFLGNPVTFSKKSGQRGINRPLPYLKNVQPRGLPGTARVMPIPVRCDFKNAWKILLPQNQPHPCVKWNNESVTPSEESSDFYEKSSSSGTCNSHFTVTIFHSFLETKRKMSMKATRDLRREVGGRP